MNQNQLFKEFEKEVWLYLDNDLPESRIIFWNKKLKEEPTLQKCIDDYLYISNKYNKINSYDINEAKFNTIIETAIIKNTLLNKLKTKVKHYVKKDTELVVGKLSFASVLIIAAIIISIYSNKTNPVSNVAHTISTELLDWNGSLIEKRINKISNLIKLSSDDDYRKYSKYKFKSDNVVKNINLLENDIDELKKEINNTKL